jgi:ABC-type antimicrobial peptide transport system permease subunit
MIEGNPNTALNGSYSIVITKKMATKMFGDEEAINKIIRIDSNNFTVTGVLKDLPINTQFDFEFILPWSYLTKTSQDDQDWGNNSCNTYVQLQPGSDLVRTDAKIRNTTIKHSGGIEQQEIFLHHISKWHLYSSFENGKIAGGRIETVRMFAIIAAFILMIACINFMNLSTARSEKRAKEVGIRKVAGANKQLLIGQFLGESILIATLAAIASAIFILIALPSFNLLVAKQLMIPYDNIYFWMAALLFIIFCGIFAGSYPAFFLSSFKPVRVLKGTFKKAHAAVNPRKVLVVVQFTFAIILVISTIIVTQQIKHAQNRQAGYERGQLVYHWISGDLYKNYPLIRNELLHSGVAVSMSRTSSPLTESFSNTWGFDWAGKAPTDKTLINRFMQDEQLVTTAGMKLVMGRDMDLGTYPSDSTAVVLNESAVKVMGFKNPLGQIVKDNNNNYTVVGVVKDFILESPFEKIAPMVILGSKMNWFNVINMKLNADNDMAKNLENMKKIFTKYNPAYPFEYHFVDEDYKRKFEDTERIATLTALFAGLTILISCLGLFGLAAYMAENRIKEIGIRKVLGASVLKITALLSKDFLMLVLISLLIASPVAWYAMHTWLQGYSYRIDVEWWVFILAGALSVLISILTVGYQAIKAAIANPVKSLRSE